MATSERVERTEKENAAWDYAAGRPLRDEITIYIMGEMISAKPQATPLTFGIAYFGGKSMTKARERYGYTHRLIYVYGHMDGPEPIELLQSPAWGSRQSQLRAVVRRELQEALRVAIAEKLETEPEDIQFLKRAINLATTEKKP